MCFWQWWEVLGSATRTEYKVVREELNTKKYEKIQSLTKCGTAIKEAETKVIGRKK